ncbi:MAG: CpaF family protein [Planctomycetaceae bacterium]|nr:CpaF family protein [Planctomycetaceae bacterium]
MKITYSSIWDPNSQTRLEATRSPLRVGRSPDSEICLASPLIPAQAACFEYRQGVWHFLLLAGQAKFQDRIIKPNESIALVTNGLIEIGPYLLTVTQAQEVAEAESPRVRLEFELTNFLGQIHADLFKILDLSKTDDSRQNSSKYIELVERKIESVAVDRGLFTPEQRPLMLHAAGRSILQQFLDSMEGSDQQRPSIWTSTDTWVDSQTMVPEHERDALQKTTAILAQLRPRISEATNENRLRVITEHYWDAWDNLAAKSFPEPLLYLAARFCKKQIKDTLFGFGPLEDLLRSSSVSEIMVVDSDHIYVEREGQLLNSGRRFLSDRVTEAVIQRIVSKVGRRIDKSKPVVDARLPDGSRVNAVIPPVAIKGPCLTIRKFPLQSLRMDDLVRYQSLTEAARSFLHACVRYKCNMLISGGTGSGKTTLLNCLTEFFDPKDRVITIEDTAELQVMQEHVVGLETKQENIEGTGALTIRDLVKNALRMRPTRIIVGEVRGGEAIDMLQAMNTGHSGCLATVHSNSPEDALGRLEVLVASDSDLPVVSIRQQIVSAIHLIVQLNRVGARRLVTEISEVLEIDDQTGRIRVRQLFALSSTDPPRLRPTGRLPTFIGHLMEKRLIDMSAFLS